MSLGRAAQEQWHSRSRRQSSTGDKIVRQRRLEMTAEAEALAQVLLNHQRSIRRPPEDRPKDPRPFTLQYKWLCERAGVPHLTPFVGRYLQQIAEWCVKNGWPPINSLAVNKTGVPGGGYDGAPLCDLLHWPQQASDSIVFAHYPRTVS
jgi:hypothetical protein